MAAKLGAAYVGVVFTTSRRRVGPAEAAAILSPLEGTSVKRVGVFGTEPLDFIEEAARAASLDIVQLVGERRPADFSAIRDSLGLEAWRVVRVGRDGIVDMDTDAFLPGDAMLLDAWSPTALGGTGHAFDWAQAGRRLEVLRQGRRLILAGGLSPANVREAIDRLAPDVVDVSSGVELSPGVKDHGRMEAFIVAATSAQARQE
jgi:phosphoribosylanthranilate isomerase